MSDIRPIVPLPLPRFHVYANVKAQQRPQFLWVNPRNLLIEESYQRNLAEKSAKLIRTITAQFEWTRMKPPICAEAEGGKYFVMDGQHTAIAAASHPEITEIPIMVVRALTTQERAASFIGHNRDRVAVTPMQMHYSALAAGEPLALRVKEACDKSGVHILKYPPPNGIYKIGDTVAAGTLRTLVEKRGVEHATRTLKLLMEAEMSPLNAISITAASRLLRDRRWCDFIDEYDLITVIRSKAKSVWFAEADEFRQEEKMPAADALASVWFNSLKSQQRRTTA